jgi:hypothetical protein
VAKRKEPFNVFYGLLLVVGVAFALTAFAYFVMATRARTPAVAERAEIMRLLDERGGAILAMELILLAVCTVGAIGWDHVIGQRGIRPTGGREPSEAPDTSTGNREQDT